MWKVQTHQGQDIFDLIQRNTNIMRKRDSQEPAQQNSVDSPPELPTRNYGPGPYVEITKDSKRNKRPTVGAKPSQLPDSRKDKKKQEQLAKERSKQKIETVPEDSTYANVDEGKSQYANNVASNMGAYSIGRQTGATNSDPEPTYAEPDLGAMVSHKKISDVVAQTKRNDQMMDCEYDHIVLSKQHSAQLPPGATGNTYDRLDGMGPEQMMPEDGTYSEIGNVRK